MRLIGPNCLGIMMPGVSLNASFSAHMPAAGNLALISQSGAIAAGMVDWAAQRAVGFSGIVSIGDQLDVDIADLLDYFALDEKTQAILLYIEAIKDARKFMSAARAAARVKPVVVVKSGRMAQGAKRRCDPYRRVGRVRTPSTMPRSSAPASCGYRILRELFDCAETLGRVKSPPGKRLAILTNGGGIGVLAVDRLVELGGIPADISPATREKLDAVLPPTWSKSNPVDIVGDADPARYAAALEALLADPNNDAVLVMNVQTAIAPADEIASGRDRRGAGSIAPSIADAAEAGTRGLGRRGSADRRLAERRRYSELPDRRRRRPRVHAPGSPSRGGGGAGAGSARHAERICARYGRGAADRCRGTGRWPLLARSDRGQAAVRCL